MEIQWSLLIFSLLAGAGGGLLVFAGISELLGIGKKTRFIAGVLALILLIVGGCASLMHLGQPSNIMAAATNIFSFSGISVELIMLGVNAIVAIIYLILARQEDSGSASKTVGIIGIITGCIMAFVVGNGYVLFGQPYWNTIALPLSYFGSGLAVGGTLFASAMIFRKEEADELNRMKPFLLGALIIQLVAFLAYGIAIGFAGDALLYWVGAIIIGSVAALVLIFMQDKNVNMVYGALICALIGGICFRALMWVLGAGFLNLFGTAAAHGMLGL